MKTIRNKDNKKVCEIDEEKQMIIIRKKEHITKIIISNENKFKIVNL